MLLRSLLNLPNTSQTLTTGLLCLTAISNLTQPLLTPFHTTTCAVDMAQPATSQWLQEQLSILLVSPYIHFKHPKFPGTHLRMGPGPIDVFSTRFANMFTKDATGVVGGKEVDRDGLKESLLALQKKWNADTAKFVDTQPEEPENHASTKFTWTPKQSDTALEVAATASVREEGGLQRISELTLEGDPELFVKQD